MAGQFSGRRVAGMVLGLVLLTAAIPPAGAYALARWRIARAQATADAAVAMLSERRVELARAAGDLDVIAGPCRMPAASASGRAWLQLPVTAGDELAAAWPVDPWGRCFLLDVRSLVEGGSGWLISAGPNSAIDTPLGARALAGDDIGARVR